MSDFDQWWFETQFNEEYWKNYSHYHQQEYNWARLGWDAAKSEAADRIEELEADIRSMVEKAASKHLPAYREQSDKLLAQQLRIEELEAGWISVEDRLPEVDEQVLIAHCYNDEFVWITSGIRTDIKNEWWCDWDDDPFESSYYHTVTHWQPLPEPPTDG